MLDRKVYRRIFALAVPAVVTNLTTPLLALCDVAVVGHLGSAVYIAAIAVGGTMFNMIYWLCGFLRMGSSGTTAQAYGAGDREGAYAVARRALLLAAAMGLLFVVLRHRLAALAMTVIDAPPDVLAPATDYFLICIWGAPAVLGTFVLTGWFLGMHNTRIPLGVSILVNVVNIALSLTLTGLCGLKMTGVAYGTLTAQWAGFAASLAAGLYRYGFPAVSRKRLADWGELRRFFRINGDIFLRTLCLVGVTLWFTRIGASQGTVMLAVNTLLMQMFTLFSYMMDGVAFAGEALCGRFYGAADRRALRDTVSGLLRVGIVGALAFTAVYFVGGQGLLSLLSSDGDVVHRSAEYFGWAVVIPAASFMAFVWDGVMIGLTRTRAMLMSMAVGALVFFGCYVVLFPRLGNHGLWIAFLSYLLCRGLTLHLLGRRSLR